MPVSVITPQTIDVPTASKVRDLAERVEIRDGQPPLSDRALTHLGSTSVEHALVTSDGDLLGYGQLDDGNGELVGSDDAVAAILTEWGSKLDTVWSHGANSPLIEQLATRGFERTRTLHQLRRSTALHVEAVPAPPGVIVDHFRVGIDEEAWLRTNAAAFADHPEQGRVNRADLDQLMSEPWFDPQGFLVARRGDEMLGYHWTKVHADGTGEVYVIGVDPAAQGLGLGKVLLAAGLIHLAAVGCPEVLLYVDESNHGAMRLYESVGFRRFDYDVQWRSAGPR